MDTNEWIERLVELLGGQTKAAKALKVSQPTVNGWLSKKHGVSVLVAMRAEQITDGEIKAASLCPGLKEIQNTVTAA